MILIISEQLEMNVNEVGEILNHRRVPWFRWNGEDTPLATGFHIDCRRGAQFGGALSTSDSYLQHSDVRVVWNRRRGQPRLAEGLLTGQEEFIRRECQHARLGVYAMLGHAAWMNDHNADRVAENKIYQLRMASSLGLNVPTTLVTQDPKAAFKFYCENEQKILCKSISPSAEVHGDETRGPRLIYANRLPGHLSLSDFEGVRLAPTLFQAYVDKRYELRVTVVGNSIFPALIDSQKSEKTSIDWRHYDQANTPYFPYHLPVDLEQKLLSLMHALNLEFGTIDLIRSTSGEYVFLEVNPGGQWGWVEGMTGQPITEAVAYWLIHRSGRS